ncbi:MAG: hypothetical protein JOZ55_08165, partial [Alphaproteobacteria bacterium]|nr:hypothetical protein [Alphaproteobacteria bacterium]
MEIAISLLAIAVIVAAALIAAGLFRQSASARLAPPDPRIDTLISSQGAIAAQFAQTVAGQNQLSLRVDALNQQLATSLAETTSSTAQTLGSIGERLSVIDEAQKN